LWCVPAHRFLEDASERAELREAVRLCVDILNWGAWAVRPGALHDVAVDDDLALDEWIAAHLGTAAHMCATVPFGVDDAPVDGRGRVRGVSGLDPSILPTRGPAAVVVAAACIVADDLIRTGAA
jgi:choline dehydrogenase-like flavoprotein